MPQHAAAFCSMPQRQILGAVGGGFEACRSMLQRAAACRSMPQRAKIFTWRTFFFITCQTLEPFVAQMSQNWMVAQWFMYQVSVRRSWVPFRERANFCLSVLLYCCTDFRFFGVVLTCQVLRMLKLPRHHRFLKPVPLSENDGTLDQQLEACRSMPQHAAASQNFLGDCWCLPTHAPTPPHHQHHHSSPDRTPTPGYNLPAPTPPRAPTPPPPGRRLFFPRKGLAGISEFCFWLVCLQLRWSFESTRNC